MERITSIDELKKVQLDILLAVHSFCENNGINYSLAYGSLLGAIRHKGFIPWDDDIDICLLREDYKKLEKAFPSLLDERYVFLSLDRDKKWNRPYGMVYDSRTIQIEDAANNYKNVGVGIDVFPIDDICTDKAEFFSYNRKRMFMVYVLNCKFLKWRKDRSFIKNVVLLISKLVCTPFSCRHIAKKLDEYARLYNGKTTEFVYHSSDTDTHLFKQFPKSIFNSFINVAFESYSVKIMSGYDSYLSNIYGDYMTPPPLDKRVSSHICEAYWK